jgi:two-component system, OmpR family, response regulator
MVAPRKDERPELDFTNFFNNPAPAVPAPTVAEQQRITEETEIGASALQTKGVFVRVVTGVKDREPAPANARILVVEDDEATATLIERVLKKGGYQITRAHNRAEIISGLNQPELPDLILLDVMLPDTNGFDVLSRLRDNARLANVRVMMLTSLNTPQDVGRGLTLGVNGYLTKPISPASLIQAIRECLGWPD